MYFVYEQMEKEPHILRAVQPTLELAFKYCQDKLRIITTEPLYPEHKMQRSV